MGSTRLPALTLTTLDSALVVWTVVLLSTPGGSHPLEWAQLVVGMVIAGGGLYSTVRARGDVLIRWILVGIAGFGALMVTGLTADTVSSRTWVRLGWAALVAGSVGALVVWASTPRRRPESVLGGGVVAVVMVVAGLGITVNCDPVLQRSWCDPDFEREQALLEQVRVDGSLQRWGRVATDAGPMQAVYLVPAASAVSATSVPDGLVYTPQPTQGGELERGVWSTASGPYAGCTVRVVVEEEASGGRLASFQVRCQAD